MGTGERLGVGYIVNNVLRENTCEHHENSLKVERLFAQTLTQKSVSLVVKTLSEVVCSRVPVRWLTTGSCP